jgi:hypothetical protein
LVEVAIAKMRIAAFYQIQVVVCSGISRQQHKNAYLAHFWVHSIQFKKYFLSFNKSVVGHFSKKMRFRPWFVSKKVHFVLISPLF